MWFLQQDHNDIAHIVNQFCPKQFNFDFGKPRITKTDEFSEKFQTAFDPPHPLIFGKSYCNKLQLP